MEIVIPHDIVGILITIAADPRGLALSCKSWYGVFTGTPEGKFWRGWKWPGNIPAKYSWLFDYDLVDYARGGNTAIVKARGRFSREIAEAGIKGDHVEILRMCPYISAYTALILKCDAVKCAEYVMGEIGGTHMFNIRGYAAAASPKIFGMVQATEWVPNITSIGYRVYAAHWKALREKIPHFALFADAVSGGHVCELHYMLSVGVEENLDHVVGIDFDPQVHPFAMAATLMYVRRALPHLAGKIGVPPGYFRPHFMQKWT